MTKLLYIPEVAERLGRSTRAVEWLLHTRQIKSGKIGGRRVVRGADLDEFIESAFVDTDSKASA